jgi:hypothetical protein
MSAINQSRSLANWDLCSYQNAVAVRADPTPPNPTRHAVKIA